MASDVDWIESGGVGTIYSYTITEHGHGVPEDQFPLVFAYVELDEGPRMMTNVVKCDPADVAVGARVEVTFAETTDEDVAIPLFTVE